MYEKITKYIKKLKCDKIGELAQKNAYGKPIEGLPFYNYTELMFEFEWKFWRFAEHNIRLRKIIRNYDLYIDKVGRENCYKKENVKNLDDVTIIALLANCLRGERFCDGCIQSHFENNGIAIKWLKRLEEIDVSNKLKQNKRFKKILNFKTNLKNMDNLEKLFKQLQKLSRQIEAVSNDFFCVFENKELDKLSSDLDTYSGLEVLALLFYFANFVYWYDEEQVFKYWQNGTINKCICKLNTYYEKMKK